MIPAVNKDLCTGCGKCMEVCPPEAIYLQSEIACIEDELCEECGFCVAECPVEAISIPFPQSGK